MKRSAEVFEEAIELAVDARAAFLDRACCDDAALRAEVESLLDAHDAAGSYLGAPTSTFAEASRDAETTPSAVQGVPSSGVIGRYKLLQQIGEGGFGTVWMAEQTRAGQATRRPQDHQAGHGHQAGHRALRGRAAGAGADGPPEHREGARRRQHRRGPAVLRHGDWSRRPDHRVLRHREARHRGAARSVHAGLPRHPARAPEGHHPPRHQAVERPGHAARRRAGAEGDRLRHRQGDERRADRADAVHRAPPVDRHAGVHEPRAGGDERAGHRHAQRHLLAGRAALRAADRDDAVRRAALCRRASPR